MTSAQKKKLEQQLWNIADQLRGKMNADEFRDYCLGFIFYKYLSERMHQYANSILQEDGIDFTEIDPADPDGRAMLDAIREEAVSELGYYLHPADLFGTLADRATEPPEFILEDLIRVLGDIEKSTMGTDSEDEFDNLFEDLDLTSTKLGRSADDKNALIAKILVHLEEIDFALDDTESDVLGDAYEYLIGQFASGAGKKAGEFYTPQAVSTILAKIVTSRKTRLKSVYDPTCGSGSLLLRVKREAEQVGDIYGQEMNRTTYNLARMNMILHGVHYRNFDLRQEDTLERPQHLDMKFEAVVANPPFSANWSASKLFESDDRFSQYGKLAPKSKADFAFVQHMLHHLDDNGTMAVVLPHGVLFRGAAEGHIRRYLIEKQNWLDAVIGLPANIFYGTSIPTAILVFKKCREHPDDVLFVDASGIDHYKKVKNQNHLRRHDIQKIVTTYRERIAEDKYSAVVPLSEIVENDYNLNIPRYVDTFEAEEPVDLKTVVDHLSVAQEVFDTADAKIAQYCKELGIPHPTGNNAELLRTYKRGLMQKIFSQELRFTRADGRPFPDWEVREIGEILTIGNGKDYKHLNEGNIPVYGTGGYMLSVDSYLYDGESVCIGRKGTIDNPTFVTGKFWTVDTLFYTHKFQGVLPKFVYYLFLRINWKQYNEASGVPSLSKSTIQKIKLSVPKAKEEQHRITDFLTAVDHKIDAVTQQITQIETFKKGLLQQMFV